MYMPLSIKTTTTTFVDYPLKKIKSRATRVTHKQSLNQFKEARGFNLTDKKKTKGRGTPEKIIEYVIEFEEWRFMF
jgi:hypothetical protein